MVFCQELTDSIWGNRKGDPRGHLQCIYADHIAVLVREGRNTTQSWSFADWTVRCRTRRGRSGAPHLGLQNKGKRKCGLLTREHRGHFIGWSVCWGTEETGKCTDAKLSFLQGRAAEVFLLILNSFFHPVNYTDFKSEPQFMLNKRTRKMCLFIA